MTPTETTACPATAKFDVKGVESGAARTPPAPDDRRSVAQRFRRGRDRKRAPYRFGILVGLALTVGLVTAFYAENLPTTGSTGSGASSHGGGAGPTNLSLGATRIESVRCGDGQNFTAEVVPWVSDRLRLATDAIFLEVLELLDGDIDGGSSPAPSVNSTSDCTRAPPTSSPAWYAVLVSPAGVNLAYYTYAYDWVILAPNVTSLTIANGSALVVMSVPELAGLSYGLCVIGDLRAPQLDVCAPL